MKKILILLLVFGAVALFASPTLASDNESTPGSSLTVTDGATDEETLTFKFSPSVVGQYMSNAATANEQWFAICTYHFGGTNFYGTSSSDTLIYNKSRDTGEALADADIPVSLTEEEGTEATDDEEAVPSVWTGWSN